MPKPGLKAEKGEAKKGENQRKQRNSRQEKVSEGADERVIRYERGDAGLVREKGGKERRGGKLGGCVHTVAEQKARSGVATSTADQSQPRIRGFWEAAPECSGMRSYRTVVSMVTVSVFQPYVAFTTLHYQIFTQTISSPIINTNNTNIQ